MRLTRRQTKATGFFATAVLTRVLTKGIVWLKIKINSVHPETTNFWMELSAVSEQQSANTLFLMSFAESQKLMADSAHPKTLVSGWALNRKRI